MADANAPVLAALVRADGQWLRCREPGCGDFAYWGAFRPTAFVLAKVQAHRARVHGAAAVKAPRPQRRNAAAAPAAPNGVAFDADVLEALQGTQLGQGAFRAAFELGGIIVKRGTRAHNRAEWECWTKAPAQYRPFLCPLLAIAPDGSWLVAQRADHVGDANWQDIERVAQGLDGRIGDLHRQNLGQINGKWVAIDYGFGWE